MEEMIRRIIELKKGDKEFILHGMSHGWFAEIGNKSQVVCLPEGGAEFSGEGATALEAVEALLAMMEGP